jgi:hypothetical protein
MDWCATPGWGNGSYLRHHVRVGVGVLSASYTQGNAGGGGSAPELSYEYVRLTIPVYLLPKLRICGSLLSLPYAPSWRSA